MARVLPDGVKQVEAYKYDGKLFGSRQEVFDYIDLMQAADNLTTLLEALNHVCKKRTGRPYIHPDVLPEIVEEAVPYIKTIELNAELVAKALGGRKELYPGGDPIAALARLEGSSQYDYGGDA